MDWAGKEEGTPLDELDLTIVEQGKMGTRAWTDAERRLVDASRRAEEQRRAEEERQRRQLEEAKQATERSLREQEEANRKLRRRSYVLLVTVAVAVVVAILAIYLGLQAHWQGQKAEEQTKEAQKNANIAKIQEKKAKVSAKDANHKAVEMLTTFGNISLEQGHMSRAMHEFALAIETCKDDEGQTDNRRKLGLLASEHPRLQSILEHGGGISSATFSRDGARILTTSGWNAGLGNEDRQTPPRASRV